MHTLTVLYPNLPEAEYDIDYYINKHMPLAAATWKPFGLKSWSVQKFAASPDGTEPAHVFAGILYFDSLDKMKQALAASATSKVMDDVANYSNMKPVIWMSEDAKTVTV